MTDVKSPEPVMSRGGLLATLDSIATTNGGSVIRNGFDYIMISRTDWEALMAARGVADELFDRLNVRNVTGDEHDASTEAEVLTACRSLGLPI